MRQGVQEFQGGQIDPQPTKRNIPQGAAVAQLGQAAVAGPLVVRQAEAGQLLPLGGVQLAQKRTRESRMAQLYVGERVTLQQAAERCFVDSATAVDTIFKREAGQLWPRIRGEPPTLYGRFLIYLRWKPLYTDIRTIIDTARNAIPGPEKDYYAHLRWVTQEDPAWRTLFSGVRDLFLQTPEASAGPLNGDGSGANWAASSAWNHQIETAWPAPRSHDLVQLAHGLRQLRQNIRPVALHHLRQAFGVNGAEQVRERLDALADALDDLRQRAFAAA